MEQRPLRLGDLVDDYCPRERRVTNHAIVAIVNDAIRQTRCTTCEAEHVFKDGKPPRRRSKGAVAADLSTDSPVGQLVPPGPLPDTAAEAAELVTPAAEAAVAGNRSQPAPETALPTEAEAEDEPESGGADQEVWSGHRPLIRATLPRSEGDVPPPRPIPEFTIYQRHNGRGPGGFRQQRGWPDRGGQGARGDRHAGAGGHGRRRHGKKRPR